MNHLDIVESYGDAHSIARIFFGFIVTATAALAAGIVILLASNDYTQALSMAVFLPFMLPVAVLVRRKRFEAAAAFLAVMLMVLGTTVATQGLGIHSISNLGIAAVLVIASMVTRKSVMLLLTLFALACMAWLVFGELAGWFVPEPLVHSIPGDFFAAALTVVMTAFIVRLLSKALLQSHQRLRTELSVRERVEGDLRKSESRWQFALEGTGDGVWDWDIRTGRVQRSRQWKAILGYETHEIGESPEELFDHLHAEDRERVKAEFDRLGSGENPQIESEFRMCCRDGGMRWILCRGLVMERAEDGKPLRCIGTHTDVTRRREASESLRQAQKMEFMGRVTSGVAHDFNNLLTIIAGNAAMIQMHLEEGSPANEFVHDVLGASKSAGDLIRQLMAFSRKQVIAPRIMHPGESLESMRRMLGRLIGEDIVLDVRIAGDLAHVRIDPVQLEQVIVNLAVNARDAMPGGGMLSIAAANAELPKASKAALGDGAGRDARAPAGRYVELTVQDTGTGFSQEAREHLFEPFFTTKPLGRGSGLGLATVHGIVLQNNGFISVDSVPGKGTVFRILLPALYPEQIPSEECGEEGEDPRGSETVLVVEDNEMVRRVISTQLGELGYAVFSFPGGEEALSWAAGCPVEIHLLVSDVVMPMVNGQELARRLLLARPHTRILFLSGYMDDIVALRSIVESGAAFLAKPFSRRDLALKVREALEAGAPQGPGRGN